MEEKTTLKKKSNSIKKLLQFILFVGLGIFFIWFSVKDLSAEDIQMIRESVSKANNPTSWFFLSLSLLIGALAHYLRALRSVLLLEPLHYKVRKSMSFYAVMVCYLSNLAFPRLGEVLRCTFLQQYEKVPFQKSLGTVVTERTLDMIIWLALLVIAILLNTSVLSNLIIDKENEISLGLWIQNKGLSLFTNYLLYILLFIVILLGITIYLTQKWWRNIPSLVKIKNVFAGIWQGLISIKDVKKPISFILYTIGIWVAYFLGNYFCFFALDYLSDLGPLAVFSVLVFGNIGYMIAQGGLGAYPLVVAGVLLLYGIDYNAGLATGWITWSVQTIMILIFGFLSLILASLAKKREVPNH